MPTISVIMPVYNEEKYIAEAMDSVLTQTFSDFEFIIIDDGSIDRTVEIIKSFQDDRIKLIQLPENKGNRYAANIGLKEATGKYIVRCDGDDISFDYRFQKQVEFMEANPDLVVSGGGLEFFGNHIGKQFFPLGTDEVKVSFIFGTGVCQGASIIKNEVLKKNDILYKEGEVSFAEDYDFFYRINLKGKAANLNVPLIKYRRHDKNVSSLIGEDNANLSYEILKTVLTNYFFSPTEKELELHNVLRGRNKNKIDSKVVKSIFQWKSKLLSSNSTSQNLNHKALAHALDQKWRKFYFLCVKSGISTAFKYIILSRGVSIKKIAYLVKYQMK